MAASEAVRLNNEIAVDEMIQRRGTVFSELEIALLDEVRLNNKIAVDEMTQRRGTVFSELEIALLDEVRLNNKIAVDGVTQRLGTVSPELEIAMLDEATKLSDERSTVVFVEATRRLKIVFDEAGVPESHGLVHALCVARHVLKALESDHVRDPDRRLSLLLAALLHDADDRKYFAPGSSNAAKILESVLADRPEKQEIKDVALEAIGYVSASQNGNTVTPRAEKDPLLLYPRFADRLEGIGEIGIVRCWQYTEEVGRPLYLDSTPAPRTEEEALACASPERFAAYMRAKKSVSLVDHVFDKLIHLVRPLTDHPNAYLRTAAADRQAPLVEICTAARPEALQARLNLAKSRTSNLERDAELVTMAGDGDWMPVYDALFKAKGATEFDSLASHEAYLQVDPDLYLEALRDNVGVVNALHFRPGGWERYVDDLREQERSWPAQIFLWSDGGLELDWTVLGRDPCRCFTVLLAFENAWPIHSEGDTPLPGFVRIAEASMTV